MWHIWLTFCHIRARIWHVGAQIWHIEAQIPDICYFSGPFAYTSNPLLHKSASPNLTVVPSKIKDKLKNVFGSHVFNQFTI